MATARKARTPAPRKKAPTTKPAVKPARARKAPARAQQTPVPAPAPAAKTTADKPKRAKLVRDSFTIPKAEYAVLQELKQRCATLGQPAKKSEVLRAGINSLAAMGDAAFAAAMATVPALKTGRPSKT